MTFRRTAICLTEAIHAKLSVEFPINAGQKTGAEIIPTG